MYTLTIDTSNQVMGISLLNGDKLVGELVTNIAKNHSVRLMPAIDQLMKETQVTPERLNKIIVAQGPGSYTGVRIGLTTAKTMAWSLEIPVIGVSSLKALAYQGRFYSSVICPFFNARRGLVYTGLYQWQDGVLQEVIEEKNVLMTDWLKQLKELNKDVLFLSPDIDSFRDTIDDYLGALAVIPDGAFHFPNPSHLLLATAEQEETVVHELTPNYLRLAEAEANWLAKQKEKK